MREGLTSRLWLALVILAFCAPLFIGLGRTDLENDEAIYSYAVDSILARGDWLDPLLSPSDQTVFLEKPPLKFWIVAAPIAAGLLPHDEAGMRVWDALFGALAFIYQAHTPSSKNSRKRLVEHISLMVEAQATVNSTPARKE